MSDADAAVDRIRSAWQEFQEMPGRANAAYRHAIGKVDEASEVLGVLVEPLRMAIVRVKKMIDDTIRQIDTELGGGRLPAKLSGGGLAATFGGGDGMGGQTGSPGAGGFRGAGGTSGGPGGPDFIDQLVDGLDVIAMLKRYDDEWFQARNQAVDVSGRIAPVKSRLERYWTGPAATSYYGIVESQALAAKQVGELATKIANATQSLVDAGNAFYKELAGCMVLIVGLIAGAIAALFGVASAPGALPLLVGALGVLVAINWVYTSFYDKQDALGSTLQGEAGNATGFSVGPSGPSWPRASALSDDVDPHDDDEKADWIPVQQRR